MSASQGVLTRVAMGLISATPLGERPEERPEESPWGAPLGSASGERLWGLLIEIVEKREGMRGRRPDQRDAGGRLMFVHRCERLEALVWVYLRGISWMISLKGE